jgi:uncharacterized protein (TIGR02284 family)
MQTQREIAISKLSELVQVSKDAEKGFRQAAAEIHDKREQATFRMTAQQRAEFALQLQDAMRKQYGVKPPSTGSLAGSLHRGWMILRYQLSLHSDGVVKKECLRGEEKALGAYQDLFWDKLLPNIEPMLEEQYVKIIEMRDRLREETHHDGIKKEDSILLL